MLPLFGPIPGGPELLIVLLMLLLMLAVPVAIAVGLFLLGRWTASSGESESDADIAALQTRIDELEAEHANRHAAESAESDHTGPTADGATEDEKPG